MAATHLNDITVNEHKYVIITDKHGIPTTCPTVEEVECTRAAVHVVLFCNCISERNKIAAAAASATHSLSHLQSQSILLNKGLESVLTQLQAATKEQWHELAAKSNNPIVESILSALSLLLKKETISSEIRKQGSNFDFTSLLSMMANIEAVIGGLSVVNANNGIETLWKSVIEILADSNVNIDKLGKTSIVAKYILQYISDVHGMCVPSNSQNSLLVIIANNKGNSNNSSNSNSNKKGGNGTTKDQESEEAIQDSILQGAMLTVAWENNGNGHVTGFVDRQGRESVLAAAYRELKDTLGISSNDVNIKVENHYKGIDLFFALKYRIAVHLFCVSLPTLQSLVDLLPNVQRSLRFQQKIISGANIVPVYADYPYILSSSMCPNTRKYLLYAAASDGIINEKNLQFAFLNDPKESYNGSVLRNGAVVFDIKNSNTNNNGNNNNHHNKNGRKKSIQNAAVNNNEAIITVQQPQKPLKNSNVQEGTIPLENQKNQQNQKNVKKDQKKNEKEKEKENYNSNNSNSLQQQDSLVLPPVTGKKNTHNLTIAA